MGLALLNPLGNRRPFLVVRKVLGQPLGVELQQARGGLERVVLGVFVELAEAGEAGKTKYFVL